MGSTPKFLQIWHTNKERGEIYPNPKVTQGQGRENYHAPQLHSTNKEIITFYLKKYFTVLRKSTRRTEYL